MDASHWVRWRAAYEDPGSSLSRRLVVVQQRLRQALDEAPAGPIGLISMCAGQGRDVTDVLVDHPRRADVAARLVESDERLVLDARARVNAAGLDRVDVIRGDASTTAAYRDAVPAKIALLCGVFGNINDADIRTTVSELPHLLAPSATVIWTRHRRPPDRTPDIRAWFNEAGFDEVAFDTASDALFGVGTTRFVGDPRPWRPVRPFTFVATAPTPTTDTAAKRGTG